MTLAAVQAGDFFVLPLTDWARESMGAEIDSRHKELTAALKR